MPRLFIEPSSAYKPCVCVSSVDSGETVEKKGTLQLHLMQNNAISPKIFLSWLIFVHILVIDLPIVSKNKFIIKVVWFKRIFFRSFVTTDIHLIFSKENLF